MLPCSPSSSSSPDEAPRVSKHIPPHAVPRHLEAGQRHSQVPRGRWAHGMTPIRMQWRQGGHAALNQGRNVGLEVRVNVGEMSSAKPTPPTRMSLMTQITLRYSYAGLGIGRREALCSTACWTTSRRNPSQQRHPCDLGASLWGRATVHGPGAGDGAQTQTKAAAIGIRPPTGEAHVPTLERPCGKGCQ